MRLQHCGWSLHSAPQQCKHTARKSTQGCVMLGCTYIVMLPDLVCSLINCYINIGAALNVHAQWMSRCMEAGKQWQYCAPIIVVLDGCRTLLGCQALCEFVNQKLSSTLLVSEDAIINQSVTQHSGSAGATFKALLVV